MPDRLVLLHALRLALIHRIWLLAVELPDFSPRHGATRESMVLRVLQLDVEPVLALLQEIFPAAPGAVVDLDFHEPAPAREGLSYAREHAAIFQPMGRLFGLVRGCGAAITHEVGAFG
jgi:phosphoenolpyruvate carboxylase